MTDEQTTGGDRNQEIISVLTDLADTIKAQNDRIDALESEPVNAVPVQAPDPEPEPEAITAPNLNTKTKRGDSEEKALAYYIRTADKGALMRPDAVWNQSLKASTDDITSIAVPANAGYAVPVGHYNQIVAKVNDADALRQVLNLTPIPGVGTTVNAQVDAAGDGQFVVTAEQIGDHSVSFDRDTPQIGRVAMTLVKYTKKVELTDEILFDEDSNLLAFIENYVGRGLANTWSNQIVTKALAGGTAALTLDGNAAITTAEVPELYYLLPDGYEDGASWVMKRTTEGMVRSLVGDAFQFAPTPAGTVGGPKTLWSTPVYNSQYMPAVGATNKSLLLGDFAYMGYREVPSMTMISDPYSVDGAIVLKYYTRFVVEVLLADAIIYATHPA